MLLAGIKNPKVPIGFEQISVIFMKQVRSQDCGVARVPGSFGYPAAQMRNTRQPTGSRQALRKGKTLKARSYEWPSN